MPAILPNETKPPEKHDGNHAEELLKTFQQQNYRRTDRLFAGLMSFQWVAGIITAVIISPRTWIGEQSQVHLHVWVAVLLGGAISFLPIAFALFRPGKPLTRHVIAAGQMLMSALLIHLFGGRIEAHFHIFGSLAFLAFYRDWTVLLTATIVVAVDHFLRGVYWPQSVFGVITVSPWRWLEHAAWVVFEDVFLVIACLQGQREMKDRAERERLLTETSQARQAEAEANAAQEARVRSILDSTADAIVTIDQDGSIKSFNAATERMFGYSYAETVGHSAAILSPELERQVSRAKYSTSDQDQRTILDAENEISGHRKDGSQFPATVRLTSVNDKKHQLILATIQDITSRKSAEQERAKLFNAIRETASHLSTASSEISATMSRETLGAEREASTVSRTVLVMAQACRSADESAQVAKDVAETAQRADKISKSGRRAIEKTRRTMDSVRDHVELTARNILILAERATAIGEITEAVKGIAEQTNILALNAAVEASRAGDAGKGFAVVAAEVKSLAGQAKKFTAQVREILNEIQQATSTAVLSTEEGTKSVAEANSVVAQTEETINDLGIIVSQAAHAAAQIVSASNEQAASMNEVTDSITEIDQTTKQTLIATQETERAAHDLKSLGIQLTRLIEDDAVAAEFKTMA